MTTCMVGPIPDHEQYYALY